MSALQSAAVVAAASARGDDAAAIRAAQAAAAAAQSAVQHTQQLQALGVTAVLPMASSITPLQRQQQATPTLVSSEEPAAAAFQAEPVTEPDSMLSSVVVTQTAWMAAHALGAEPCASLTWQLHWQHGSCRC